MRLSNCLNCNEFFRNHKGICSYKCSKRKNKITLKRITILEIKKVLENNIGCNISDSNISIYSREILNCLNKNRVDY